jgi:predicted nucleotidyltransferase
MPETNFMNEKIEEMKRRIVEKTNPDKIILFGSHARGTAGLDSDVDLLVVLRIKDSKRKKAVEIYRYLAGIGLAKDVIVVTPEEIDKYRNVPGTLIRTALREGKVLYERNA